MTISVARLLPDVAGPIQSTALGWYSRLAARDREFIDVLAAVVAHRLFQKALNNLTAVEAEEVLLWTERSWF